VEELLLSTMNVHKVSDVRQKETHKAEPLVPETSTLEAETDVAKLKKYKSSDSNHFQQN
jgi:hypothetical protein